MNLHQYITVSPDVQFGKPVFKGTRVPVQSLFLHLEQGIGLKEFLEGFPSVSKEQAKAGLEFFILNKVNKEN
jgi:uncharacterized protein (DUF433 family)